MNFIAFILTAHLFLLIGACQCEEAVGKWGLPKERLDNSQAFQEPNFKKAIESIIIREFPGSSIDFWNDRGTSWDIRVVYLKVLTKEGERLVSVSFSNQTREAKVEGSWFLSGGIASKKKIAKEDVVKIISAFRGNLDLDNYVPAFFSLSGEGDEKDVSNLPLGTWGYVIGEREIVDRKKGQSRAEVYLSKDFRVIEHHIVGSIE